tara:strand:- start:153 stop:1061 length:909 start_codon:yes stop_codon:yes gene_type:complete
MTTQDLYTKLSTGDITEQKFLYEVRRDINLPFITPMNNFKDTVTILKNKGIISEKQTKLSTGKQEVDIIAKTIDMVNPYEYSKGMDIELGVENEAVGNVDITEEDIKKAQKKVLKNLTKEPNYYSKKNTATMGDSEYDVEVTPKVIEKIQKDAKKNNKKFIREHGEDAERVDDVNASSTMLEDESVEELGRLRDSIYEKYAKKYGVDVNELKDKVEAKKLETENIDKTTKLAIEDEIAQWRKGNLSKEQLKKSLMDLSDGEFQLDSIKGFNNEAITVSDEDTAIKIAKKDPNADVKVMKMGI